MKLILILLFSIKILTAQDFIQRDIFEVCYSSLKKQPLWLVYEVECHDGGFSRKGLSFKKDTHFNGITSDNTDYYKNVWDKGHLAPAADFSCSYEKLSATFNYLNCALQHEKLNRGPWKNLEKFERKLSETYTVSVMIILEFDEQSILLASGALVPSYFVKILSFDNKIQAYRFPNNASVYRAKWEDYLLTYPYPLIEGCVDVNLN